MAKPVTLEPEEVEVLIDLFDWLDEQIVWENAEEHLLGLGHPDASDVIDGILSKLRGLGP